MEQYRMLALSELPGVLQNGAEDEDYAQALAVYEAMVQAGIVNDFDGFTAACSEEGYAVEASGFSSYAEELAYDTGLIDAGKDGVAYWPLYCIDWEHAARELAHDYASFTFDGSEYMVRFV
jgi:hypothetical protein